MSLNWTRAQRDVITRYEGDFAVLASAGSGKTAVVVQRYLNLILEQGSAPSQILCVTFTRKATYEMKTRIVAGLRAIGLADAAQEAETGPILTIDSLYQRILHENAVVAGLDPRFEILREPETEWLMRDAIRQSILEIAQTDDAVGEFLERVVGKVEYDGGGAYQVVEASVQRLMSAFRSSGRTASEIRNHFADPEALIELEHGRAIQTLPEPIRTAPDFITGEGWIDRAIEIATRLRMKGQIKWLVDYDREPESERGRARRLNGLVTLALSAWMNYEGELTSRQKMDYTMQQIRTLRLLDHHPEVTERLNRQYRHVMVDEAQDIDPLQFEFLGRLSPVSMLWVGDDKQSIYSFRNADVEQFRAKALNNSISLAESHRATPDLQRLVDRVFENQIEDYVPMQPRPARTLDDDPFGSEPFAGVEIWRLSGPNAWPDLITGIQRLLESGVPAGDICVLVNSNRAGESLTSAFQRHQLSARVTTMGELYNKQDVVDLANAIRALCNPGDDLAHLIMLRSPLVGLSMDAIALLGTSPIGVRRALSEFVSPVPSDAAKLVQWRSWFDPLEPVADRIPGVEVLSRIVANSPLYENLIRLPDGRIRVELVRELQMFASENHDLSGVELAEKLDRLNETKPRVDQVTIADRADDLVTISTIHKAKGLEWPVVIIADAPDYVARGHRNQYEFDSASMEIFSPQAETRTLGSELSKRRSLEAAQRELVRKAYVAMTRARHRLIIAEWPGRKGELGGLNRMMASALGGDYSGLARTIFEPDPGTSGSDWTE